MRALPSTWLASVVLLAHSLRPAPCGAAPLPYLQPGYAQEVYAVYDGHVEGLAFAPDGDVWASTCTQLVRFDAQSTSSSHGSLIHPVISNVPLAWPVCKITNHPDGRMYGFSTSSLVRFDAQTGAELAYSEKLASRVTG